MNCLSWNVGHLAWQEQRYCLRIAQGQLLLSDIHRDYASGAPACSHALTDMLTAWKAITAAADPWLDSLTTEMLSQAVMNNSKPTARSYGSLAKRQKHLFKQSRWSGVLPGCHSLWAISTTRRLIGRNKLSSCIAAFHALHYE